MASIFDPVATFKVSSPQDELAAAMSEPYVGKDMFDDPGLKYFTDAVKSSFGIGTAIREAELPPIGFTATQPNRFETPDAFAKRRAAALAENPPLTMEQYKASPSFRDGLPWEPGLTEDRAAARANQYDDHQVTSFFAQKQPLSALFYNFLGSAVDPINYIPIFGEAASAAAAARLGSFGAHVLMGAANGAVSTAAFGALTADLRGKLGDDVSFNGMINEIAMSGLIGGVFGAGFWGLAKGARAIQARALMAKATDGLQTVENVAKSRAVAEVAADMLANRGEVKLPPAAVEEVRGIQQAANQVTAPERELRATAADIVASPPRPGELEITTPNQFKVKAVPQWTNLRDVAEAQGANQIRDRGRAASDVFVETQSGQLRPNDLLPSPVAALGVPVTRTNPAGVEEVASGHGRRRLILRAAEAHPEVYQQYLQTMTEKAGLGPPPPSVKGDEVWAVTMHQVTPLSEDAQASWNADANAPLIPRLSAAETAQMDGAALTDGTLGLLNPGDLNSAANLPFRREFLAAIPDGERPALMASDGSFSADGIRRIENAIVAAAYGKADPGVVQRFTEATDENSRAIIGAMADVAPDWARFVRSIERQEVDPIFDVTPELTQALRLLTRWRDQATRERRAVSQVIRENMNQLDAFAGDIKPEVKGFIRMFYNDGHFGTAKGRDSLAAALQRTLTELKSNGEPSLFADPKHLASPLEIITHVADNGSRDLWTYESDIGGAGSGDGAQAIPGGSAKSSDGGGSAKGASVPAVAPAPDAKVEVPAAVPGRPLVLDALPESQRPAAQKAFVASQPSRSIDELFGVNGEGGIVHERQAELVAFDKQIRQKYGIKAPEKYANAKKRVTTEQKMQRMGYKSTSQLTDLVRTGFIIDTTEQADLVVNELSSRYAVMDEGWFINDANYFDRKVLVQFDDGTIGEVQFWHPDMFDAKEGSGGGHKLYEEARDLEQKDPNNPRVLELYKQMQKLYSDALAHATPAWRGMIEDVVMSSKFGISKPGKAAENAASVMGRPESVTSSQDTLSHLPPSESTAAAARRSPSDMMTAGRDSQSKNLVSIGEDIGRGGGFVENGVIPDVADPISPPNDPVPPEVEQARARVLAAETLDEVALLGGVDAKTGEYAEAGDIKQIEQEGRLTPEDQAALDQATENYDNAVAYGKALEAAVTCVK